MLYWPPHPTLPQMLLALEQGIQELKVLPCAQADEKRHTSDGGGLRRLLEAAGVTSDNLLGVVELCSKGAKLMGETARPPLPLPLALPLPLPLPLTLPLTPTPTPNPNPKLNPNPNPNFNPNPTPYP